VVDLWIFEDLDGDGPSPDCRITVTHDYPGPYCRWHYHPEFKIHGLDGQRRQRIDD
jgi:hypothetical protein